MSKFYIARTPKGYFINGKQAKMLSNFTLSFIGEEKASNGDINFFVKISTADGKEFLLSIPSEELVDHKRARTFLARKVGLLLWKGTQTQFSDMLEYERAQAGELRQMRTINYRGLVSEGGERIFLYNNGYLTKSSAVFSASDEISLEKVSLLRVQDDGFAGIQMNRDKDYSRILDITTTFTPAQTLVFAWFCMVPYYSEITDTLSCFPILWISGQRGSGKSTFSTLLLSLFVNVKAKGNALCSLFCNLTSSLASIERTLIRHSSFPIILDEYRPTLLGVSQIKTLIMNAYDRGAQGKGTIGSSAKTDHTELVLRSPRSPVVITSQSTPNDPALSDRIVYIEFSKDVEVNGDRLLFWKKNIGQLRAVGRAIMQNSLFETFFRSGTEQFERAGDRKELSKALLKQSLMNLVQMKIISPACSNNAIQLLHCHTEEVEIEEDDVEKFLDMAESAIMASNSSTAYRGRYFDTTTEAVCWLATGALFDKIEKELHKDIGLTKGALCRLVSLEAMPGMPQRRYISNVGQQRVHFFSQGRIHERISRWCEEGGLAFITEPLGLHPVEKDDEIPF